MQTYNSMLPDLLGAKGIVGIPPDIAIFHLRKAAIEFCQRSHVWVQQVFIDAQEAVSDYPIELEDDASVVAVKKAYIGEQEQYITRFTNRTGLSQAVFVDGSTVWVPTQHADIEQHIRLEVVCKPTQTSMGIPQTLADDWVEVVVDGAAAACFAMPKTEWYSAGMVAYYAKRFNAGLTRAKNRRALQHSAGPLMMRGGRF